MKKRHGAKIELDNRILLKLLDFEGGTIHDIFVDRSYLAIDRKSFFIMLEHPDLPELKPGMMAETITPTYQSDIKTDELGIYRESITRIEPPKKGEK